MRISDWSSDVCSSDLDGMQQVMAFDLSADRRVLQQVAVAPDAIAAEIRVMRGLDAFAELAAQRQCGPVSDGDVFHCRQRQDGQQGQAGGKTSPSLDRKSTRLNSSH